MKGLDDVVDTTSLLRSCVQTAVGMLRDQITSGFRSTQRVEILLTLLTDNDKIQGKNMIYFIVIVWTISEYNPLPVCYCT